METAKRTLPMLCTRKPDLQSSYNALGRIESMQDVLFRVTEKSQEKKRNEKIRWTIRFQDTTARTRVPSRYPVRWGQKLSITIGLQFTLLSQSPD